MITYLILYFLFKRLKEKPKPARQRKPKRQPEPLPKHQVVDMEKLEKEKQRKRIQQEKQLEKEKRQQERYTQALHDIDFYNAELTLLKQIVVETRQDYKNALQLYNSDIEKNSNGSYIVKEETIQEHKRQRDKLLKKMLSLENKIFQLNRKITQAENIL